MKYCNKHNIEYWQKRCPKCKSETRTRCKANKENGTARKNNNLIINGDIIEKMCNICCIYMSLDLFNKGKARCKVCEAKIHKEYYENNRQKYIALSRANYNNNLEYCKKQRKEYRKINKDKIRENARIYDRKRSKIKRKNDPAYRLRSSMSKSIHRMLKSEGSSKKGESCLKYLPYTVEQLKYHIEFLFEPWINWNNQGVYDTKTWDDNDISTWTWNIDHIIPQSFLPYSSMEDDNFQKCWALDNLRPYSAKRNILDGNRRYSNGI